MRHHHVHTKEFIVGAAIGSLLGSVAALLIAPKSGKKLREAITRENRLRRSRGFGRRPCRAHPVAHSRHAGQQPHFVH